MFDQEKYVEVIAFLQRLGFRNPVPNSAKRIVVKKYFPKQGFTIYVDTGFVQGDEEVKRQLAFVCSLKCKRDNQIRFTLKCRKMSANWKYNLASQISKLEHLMAIAPNCTCGATTRLIVNRGHESHEIFWACTKGKHKSPSPYVFNIPRALEIALLPEIDEE